MLFYYKISRGPTRNPRKIHPEKKEAWPDFF